jgi:predicted DNA-binding transcriptional regulator YafY
VRRADRLFEIVQYLRGRRLTTAAQLAQWLEVSERTIYRDIADLTASGVPIDGEAGVGYRLHPHFDLPPLMFSYEEIDALVMGARFVESWGGPQLAHAARAALAKIAAALPEQKRTAVHESRLFAPGFFIDPQWGQRLDALRAAIVKHLYVEFEYHDGHEQDSQRRVRPFAVFFWGGTWTLGAWCELRRDFRNFRLDRFVTLQVCAQEFPDEPGRRFDDYMKRMTES